uniref:G-protein coupled receptors family 1 profile domain-containing protein n=1 Tax=Panagrolaimus davidi TaxID=227884 RepID=A0A914Q2Y7_9BILA
MFTQTLSNIDNYCGTFCYEDWGTHQSRRRAYGTVMLTLQFIIPLSIIIICYTAISVRLGQSLILKTTKKRDYDWQLQVTDQQRAANKRRQRTNRMFIGMVVAFSLSWFWSVLFNVLRDYEILPTFAKQQEFFVGILTHCIAMTSTVWNPLLYAMLNFQLRAAFLQLMPECIRDTFCSKVSSSSSIPHDDITRRKPPAITIANGNAKNANNNKKSSTSLRPTTPSTLLIANNNAQGISTIDDDDDNFNYNSDGTKYGSFDTASYFSTIIKHPKSASFHAFNSCENLQSVREKVHKGVVVERHLSHIYNYIF